MSQSRGQQIVVGLAVLLGVVGTLAAAFILAQADAPDRQGDITQPSPTPTEARPASTVTLTPTSAILESTSLPTAQPPPEITDTPVTCDFPDGWQPAIVGQSDTLASLAARYGTTAETLMQGNCLADASLQAGQQLYVPSLPTATEDQCGPPSGWVTYTVMPGENLFRIGLRYGQNVNQMLRANCLSSDRVNTGQTLFVPPVTPRPATPKATTETETLTADETPAPVTGCDNPGAQISSPNSGAVLTGDVAFLGTATSGNFSFFKLEIRAVDDTEFITFTDNSANTAVEDGLLGQVGAYAFTPGDYEIKLSVVDTTSAVVGECSITVSLQGGPTSTPNS